MAFSFHKLAKFQYPKAFYFLGFSGLFLLVIILISGGGKASDLPSAKIQFGNFKIELTATGEIQAARSINISAPRVRTNLQIVKLAPEGTVVDSGDFLVQFDTEELQKNIEEKQSELEIAQANLDKSHASMEANMAQLTSALENSKASYELAQLRLSQMAFEAEVKVQEEKLRLKQAEISLRQAEAKIESQKEMDAAELKTLELKIQQAKAELDKAKKELSQLTMTAPAPGLVVYNKIWKGSGMEKIKVGDTPWRGQSLIQLPDLSSMQVEIEISEADIGKLKVEQTATIKLDAYPDPTFTGAIKEIASLAHEKERQIEIKVFDVVISINEMDEVLKPGMTAKVKILIDAIPDQFFLPIEAVFENEGKQIIYPLNKISSPVEVVPGKRNENFVTIEGNVSEGMPVSLVDPNKPIEVERGSGKAEKGGKEGVSKEENGTVVRIGG